MSQAGGDIKRRRIPEIDFWRGFALIVILVDHIPWNGLDYLTPQNFGFSDAAEAFVFLSGVSVSFAYAPTLQKAGFRRLVERCATRAGKLYLVQIAIVACSIAIPLAVATVVGDQRIALVQGASRFLASPVSALVGAVTLAYQPNFSNVLALYVVFDALGAGCYFSGVTQFCFGACCVHRCLFRGTRPPRSRERWLVVQSLRLAACVYDWDHLRLEMA
jgi:hypothetical protein